jgi:hypothetical protein
MPVVVGTENRSSLLKAVASFLASFVITAGVVGLAIRDPLHLHADVRSEKLQIMQDWAGVATSAAFGSSHLHYGFDPRAFDRSFDLGGLPTHTVNLAVEGGSQSEQRVMALEYLKGLKAPAAGASPQACMILLELNAGANFTNEHLVHPRSINIYDWQTTRFISRLTTPGMSLPRKAGRVGFAVAAMGLHYLNVGMLSDEIFAPPIDQTVFAYQTAEDRRGIKITPVRSFETAAMQKLIDGYPKGLTTSKGEITGGLADLVSELDKASPVRNLSFAYVVMPRLDNLRSYETYPDEMDVSGHKVAILNLGRPDVFPQLYEAGLFSDDSHLNERGAALTSTLLAEQLRQWFATHGGPERCGG